MLGEQHSRQGSVFFESLYPCKEIRTLLAHNPPSQNTQTEVRQTSTGSEKVCGPHTRVGDVTSSHQCRICRLTLHTEIVRQYLVGEWGRHCCQLQAKFLGSPILSSQFFPLRSDTTTIKLIRSKIFCEFCLNSKGDSLAKNVPYMSSFNVIAFLKNAKWKSTAKSFVYSGSKLWREVNLLKLKWKGSGCLYQV